MQLLPFDTTGRTAVIEAPRTLSDRDGFTELFATLDFVIQLQVSHIIIDLSYVTEFDKTILGVFATLIRKTVASDTKLWITHPPCKMVRMITTAQMTSLLPRCDI